MEQRTCKPDRCKTRRGRCRSELARESSKAVHAAFASKLAPTGGKPHQSWHRLGRVTQLAGVLEPHRRDGGFSLVEVLVALLVLAIGLLGLAALQAQGMRFNHDAYVRTQATNLAYDIVDRMRVNNTNLAAYTAADSGDACDPLVAGATMDLNCWYRGLAASIPGGSGLIVANAAANFYDVTVRWIDRTPRDFGAGAVHAPATAAECNAIAARLWNGVNCMVQQTWTVWP